MAKIELGDGKKIEMREPKLRDMVAVNHIRDDTDREMAVISNLTGLTKDEMLDLPWAKYQELQSVFMGFQYTKPKK